MDSMHVFKLRKLQTPPPPENSYTVEVSEGQIEFAAAVRSGIAQAGVFDVLQIQVNEIIRRRLSCSFVCLFCGEG